MTTRTSLGSAVVFVSCVLLFRHYLGHVSYSRTESAIDSLKAFCLSPSPWDCSCRVRLHFCHQTKSGVIVPPLRVGLATQHCPCPNMHGVYARVTVSVNVSRLAPLPSLLVARSN